MTMIHVDLGQQTVWDRSGQEIQMTLWLIDMLKKLSEESATTNTIGCEEEKPLNIRKEKNPQNVK